MVAGLPNITGSTRLYSYPAEEVDTGALYREDGAGYVDNSIGQGKFYRVNFDASLSNPIYGNSDTVTPLSLSTKFFIKY